MHSTSRVHFDADKGTCFSCSERFPRTAGRYRLVQTCNLHYSFLKCNFCKNRGEEVHLGDLQWRSLCIWCLCVGVLASIERVESQRFDGMSLSGCMCMHACMHAPGTHSTDSSPRGSRFLGVVSHWLRGTWVSVTVWGHTVCPRTSPHVGLHDGSLL